MLNVLEKLFFIDSEILRESDPEQGHIRYTDLKNEVKETQSNLLIQTEDSPSNRQEDIQANMFKVICAIMKLKAVERGSVPFLEQNLLDTYLDQIETE